jgi:hypothetical protein
VGAPIGCRRVALRRLIAGGVTALVLLILGEVGLAALPVHVSLEIREDGRVTMDEGARAIEVPDLPAGTRIRFEQPGPAEREYQIDGSDTTARNDRNPAAFRAVQNAPWYRLMAWIRDEGSYSRWQDIELVDLSDDHVIASGIDAVERATLPAAFRVDASLRRPEAPARIWLLAADDSKVAGLTLDRDAHQATWQIGADDTNPAAWFFPNDPWPFAAELIQLVGRSAVAAFVLLGAMALLGSCVSRLARARSAGLSRAFPPVPVAAVLVLGVWFTAVLWITIRLYHQLPHIVDAQAYYFQARIFETGRTWLATPDIVDMLDGFQQVEWNGRWFAQYPPGAPALYALGGLLGLAWLVGPLATLALAAGTAIAGTLLFDRWVGLTALVLLAISPFVLFQAGSFMSHPIAGGAAACALAAFAWALRTRRAVAYVLVGGLLGLAFDTREVAAILYGLVFGVWLLAARRWRGLGLVVAAAVPFLVAYLLFNVSTTDDVLTLPRNLFNPNDRWGFGDVGPLGQHTLAAGLVNTDENLTLLQFDLFGWPPLAALSLIGMPFLLGRAGRFDYLLAACAGAFVLAYVGYFYQGIALGPRYYFEAVPAFALLAARGLQDCVGTLIGLGMRLRAARIGAGVVVAALCAWTFGYYLPHAIERRMDFGATNGRPMVMPFVENTLAGPRLTGVEPPALVVVPNGDVFKSLSALNCPLLEDAYLEDCPVLLLSANLTDAAPLYARFANRSVWLATLDGNLVTLQRVRNTT